jgi:hypothetical protein
MLALHADYDADDDDDVKIFNALDLCLASDGWWNRVVVEIQWKQTCTELNTYHDLMTVFRKRPKLFERYLTLIVEQPLALEMLLQQLKRAI